MALRDKRNASLDEERWMNYYWSVVEEGREVMYHVTKAMYKGGEEHPQQYCKSHFSHGGELYYSFFKRDQIKMLDAWPIEIPYDISKASSKWDISLHFSFLLHMCGVSKPSARVLKMKLQAVKKHRDYVSHGMIVLTQKELSQKIHELEELYSFILQYVSDHSKVNLESVRHKIAKQLYNRMFVAEARNSSEIDNDWDLKQTKEKLKEQHSVRKSVIPAGISECKPVPVKDFFYARNVVVSDGDSQITSDSTSASNVSSSLDKDEKFEDRGTSFVDADSKFSEEDSKFETLLQQSNHTVSVKKLLSHLIHESCAEHLIITGRSGSGKSTLLLYILAHWCTGSGHIDGLDDIDLVFYVDLPSTQSSTLASLLQTEILMETCSTVHVSTVIAKLRQLNVLWLLDGFDQTSADTRNLTQEIIQKFPLVLTTSRRECLPMLKAYKDTCTVIGQFESLSFESSKDFAHKIVSVLGGKDSAEKFEKECLQKEVDPNGFKQCLLSSPVDITRLCFLWVNKPLIFAKITTSTELHYELLCARVAEVVKKVSKKRKTSKEDAMKKVSQWLIKLGEVVWQCRLNDTRFISEWDIKFLFSACDEIGLSGVKTDLMSAFLEMKEYNRCNLLGSTTTYCIPDDNLLGYLAAQHLYTIASKDPVALVSNLTDKLKPFQLQSEKVSQIFINFIGILSTKSQLDLPFIGDLVQTIFGLGFKDWLTLLREGKCNKNLSRIIANLLTEGLDVFDEDLIFRWNPLLSLLCQKKLTHIRLLLKRPPENLNEVIAFLHVICDFVGKLCVFCAWSVKSVGQEQCDDEILKAVSGHKTCQLVCFHGSLTANAIEKIMPSSVRFLHLRLSTLDQLTALQQYLWENGLLKLNLVIDFPWALYPGKLCKLDLTNFKEESKEIIKESSLEKDKGSKQNDAQETLLETGKKMGRKTEEESSVENGKPSVNIQDDQNTTSADIQKANNEEKRKTETKLRACIPNIDDNHLFWAMRVLQNLTDSKYEEVCLPDSHLTEYGVKQLLDYITCLNLHVKTLIILKEQKISIHHPVRPSPKRTINLKDYIPMIRKPVIWIRSVSRKEMMTNKYLLLLIAFAGSLIVHSMIDKEFAYIILFNAFFLGPSLIGFIVLLVLIAVYKET